MEIGGRKLGAQSQVNDILGNAVFGMVRAAKYMV